MDDGFRFVCSRVGDRVRVFYHTGHDWRHACLALCRPASRHLYAPTIANEVDLASGEALIHDLLRAANKRRPALANCSCHRAGAR
jgi:hypothetical protein